MDTSTFPSIVPNAGLTYRQTINESDKEFTGPRSVLRRGMLRSFWPLPATRSTRLLRRIPSICASTGVPSPNRRAGISRRDHIRNGYLSRAATSPQRLNSSHGPVIASGRGNLAKQRRDERHPFQLAQTSFSQPFNFGELEQNVMSATKRSFACWWPAASAQRSASSASGRASRRACAPICSSAWVRLFHAALGRARRR
jgi:hypothetical protein